MTKIIFNLPLIDFLPEFFLELEHQLLGDQERWGNTWIERGRDGQEERFIEWVKIKYNEYHLMGRPFPWMKLAGEALIGWAWQNYWESITKIMEKYSDDGQEDYTI